MLKNEPPYSFFAADLLVALRALLALVVLQVLCDLVTCSTLHPPLVACKKIGTDIPKSVIDNAPHEKKIVTLAFSLYQYKR